MVEGASAEVGGPLSLLWDKWELPCAQEILSACLQVGVQVDKPSESKEEYELCQVLEISGV